MPDPFPGHPVKKKMINGRSSDFTDKHCLLPDSIVSGFFGDTYNADYSCRNSSGLSPDSLSQTFHRKLRYHNRGAKIHYLFEIIHILLIKNIKKQPFLYFMAFCLTQKKNIKVWYFEKIIVHLHLETNFL